ncbi:MAG: hypothetical protein Q8K68_13420 [Nitrospirota bacterium]|nr:hypothetical protein [Nitrospirota bacterium]
MAVTTSHSAQKQELPDALFQRPVMLLAVLLAGLCVRLIHLHEISAYPDFDIPFAGLDEELNNILARRVACG